jgi:hypothetical protein
MTSTKFTGADEVDNVALTKLVGPGRTGTVNELTKLTLTRTDGVDEVEDADEVDCRRRTS